VAGQALPETEGGVRVTLRQCDGSVDSYELRRGDNLKLEDFFEMRFVSKKEIELEFKAPFLKLDAAFKWPPSAIRTIPKRRAA